jgi:phage host-nuclease inhibitor protein Gam
MSKDRIKIPLPQITTREEAEAVMNELALCANNRRKIVARMDAAVLKIQEAEALNIGICDAAIAERSDALRAWAEAHPEEFPKGRKSIEFLSGTLGFRTGTPKLALLSRAFTWDKVRDLVAQIMPHYIRTKLEVDKEAMLADYGVSEDKGVTADKFKRAGVKVTQDEAFFIEPKLSDADLS